MTNESDALIEQLRQHDAGISRSGVSVTIFSEAADRIAALEAERKKPTGWIITHKETGRVIHLSKYDGWTIDEVTY